MNSKIPKFIKSNEASAVVIFAVTAPLLITVVAVALTYGNAVNGRSHLQNALDSAVLAATAVEGAVSTDMRVKTASRVFKANVEKYTTDETVPNAKFSVSGDGVEGTSTFNVESPFTGWLGYDNVPVSVSSKAIKGKSAPICILMLNQNEERAIEVYGNAKLTAHDCAGQANSTDSAGMKQYGRMSVAIAEQFAVGGGFEGENFKPTPNTGVEATADPYVDVPFPATGPCVDVADKLIQEIITLSPGTYCGGLTIKAQSAITLRPGIYIMKDGPFRVDSNARIRGENVMIALLGAGSTIYLRGGADIDLTSPRSGPYMNMQIMSDGIITEKGSWFGEEWTEFHGNNTVSLDGVIYLPEQDLWFGGGSQLRVNSPTMAIIGDQLWLQDRFDLEVWYKNTRDLPIKEPAMTFAFGARLVK